MKPTQSVGENIRAARSRMRVPNEGQTVEDFGQLLRHELNNPLTGILGNAELLLSEIRRKNGGRMPQSGQMRLETIAALVVRLRETVRRLSQEWKRRKAVRPRLREFRFCSFQTSPLLLGYAAYAGSSGQPR